MSSHTFQRTQRQGARPDRRTWRHRYGDLTARLLGWAVSVAATLRSRIDASRTDEAGNVITDNLAWIVFGVVAIVAIGALIKTLGSDVINWVQTQLGIA